MSVDRLYRKGLILEYLTVAYNILEAIASVVFGGIAGSIALIGFGLDSIIESLSGLVLIWRLRQHDKLSEVAEERLERRAIRFVAITFFVLGLYVLVESVRKLVLGEVAEASLPGIIIALVSLIAMPLLSWQKYRTGKQMPRIPSSAILGRINGAISCFRSNSLMIGATSF